MDGDGGAVVARRRWMLVAGWCWWRRGEVLTALDVVAVAWMDGCVADGWLRGALPCRPGCGGGRWWRRRLGEKEM